MATGGSLICSSFVYEPDTFMEQVLELFGATVDYILRQIPFESLEVRVSMWETRFGRQVFGDFSLWVVSEVERSSLGSRGKDCSGFFSNHMLAGRASRCYMSWQSSMLGFPSTV